MLFLEAIFLFSENHTKAHLYVLRKNSVFLNLSQMIKKTPGIASENYVIFDIELVFTNIMLTVKCFMFWADIHVIALHYT
jgi:hypothetical protein